MKLRDTWPEKIIGIEKISETDFSSRSYTFTEKKPLANSFGEARYKNKKPTYFIILDDLL